MNYKNRVFIIENITNMHVGSGEANFGIIDNLIQRDVLTGYPTIHSSSLKGALREFFEIGLKESEEFIKYVFGDENKNPGNVKFFEAVFLGMPLRSSKQPYVFATSAFALKNLFDFLNHLGVEIPLCDQLNKLLKEIKDNNETISNGDYEVEDEKVRKSDIDLNVLSELFKEERIMVYPEKFEGKFKEYVEDLPTIARNKLENGISVNLFYEEVLPKKSKFFTVFSFPTNLNKDDKEQLEKFEEEFVTEITSPKNVIQLGANASIGYGICRFREIGK